MRAKQEPACACPTCGKPTVIYSWRDSKPQAEDEAYRKRIRNLIAKFELEGYETYERDLEVSTALATMMASASEKPHLQQLLSAHMERIIAYQILENS